MSFVRINSLSKQYFERAGSYAREFDVLKNIDLDIASGELVAFFGPNGSGKSTLFRLIAGLETPTSGSVTIDGKLPKDARIGFVFQDYRASMLPWRSVQGNIALSLEARGLPHDEIQKKSLYYLQQVGMDQYKNKYFYELSGGMAQATAIGRALAYEPNIFLLDEPFSALDFETTLETSMLFLDIWSKNEITSMVISHQPENAVFLADRVVVLSSRPGTVVDVITVPLARPRHLGQLETKEFFDTRNKVLEAFKRGHVSHDYNKSQT